jgi:hypothetical protein
MLDHAEPDRREPMEQAHAEDPANLAFDHIKPLCIPPLILSFYFNYYFYAMLDPFDHIKPLCIPPLILSFYFNYYFYAMLDCALSYRNCVGSVVALWLSFRIILANPFLIVVSH